ncbi:hypothetical protein C8R48DRAFT_677748 [Suillus tomentosus]|nr:hypothetical protein C8R48DRAFT_677748 [Suillus tomentosus]
MHKYRWEVRFPYPQSKELEGLREKTPFFDVMKQARGNENPKVGWKFCDLGKSSVLKSTGNDSVLPVVFDVETEVVTVKVKVKVDNGSEWFGKAEPEWDRWGRPRTENRFPVRFWLV